jgi:hypothetical protein
MNPARMFFMVLCAAVMFQALPSHARPAARSAGNDKVAQPAADAAAQAAPGSRELSGRVKEAFGVWNRMMEIERKTISQDPELTQMHEQMKALHEQFRTKLDGKLKDDKEYQDLKVRIVQMRSDVQKYRKNKGPDRSVAPPPAKQ